MFSQTLEVQGRVANLRFHEKHRCATEHPHFRKLSLAPLERPLVAGLLTVMAALRFILHGPPFFSLCTILAETPGTILAGSWRSSPALSTNYIFSSFSRQLWCFRLNSNGLRISVNKSLCLFFLTW